MSEDEEGSVKLRDRDSELTHRDLSMSRKKPTLRRRMMSATDKYIKIWSTSRSKGSRHIKHLGFLRKPMFTHGDEVDQTPGTFSALEGFEVLGVGSASDSGRRSRIDCPLPGRMRVRAERNRGSMREICCRNVSPCYLKGPSA